MALSIKDLTVNRRQWQLVTTDGCLLVTHLSLLEVSADHHYTPYTCQTVSRVDILTIYYFSSKTLQAE